MQEMFLYRWMGPACSKWQMKNGWFGNQNIKQFISTLCQKRFAFLKTMLCHSYLFIFVKPEQAEQWFSSSNSRPGCLGFELRNPNGKAILVLDNCLPGCIRIIGKRTNGKPVNQRLDVASMNLVVFDEKWKDAENLKFNHWETLYNLMDYIRVLDVDLITNFCWKKSNSPKQQKQQNAPEKLGASGEPDSRPKLQIKYQQALQKSNAAMMSQVMKEAGISKKYKVPEYFYVPEQQAIDKLDMKSLQDYFEKVLTISAPKKFVKGKTLQSTALNFNLPSYDARYDETFRSCVLSQHLMTPESLKDYESQSRRVIDHLSHLTSVKDVQLSGVEKKNWKNWDSGATNGHLTMTVVNILMVNPFLLLFPSSDHVKGFIGDIWFLQSLVSQLEHIKSPYCLIKLYEISSPKNGKGLLEQHLSDPKSHQIYDTIYQCAWSGIF